MCKMKIKEYFQNINYFEGNLFTIAIKNKEEFIDNASVNSGFTNSVTLEFGLGVSDV